MLHGAVLAPRLAGTVPIVTCLHTSCAVFKVVPKNLKGKSKSSQDWLTRQLNDPYVKLAKQHQYRYGVSQFVLTILVDIYSHCVMYLLVSVPFHYNKIYCVETE